MLVSVIIPVYNHAALLPRAVASVVEQSIDSMEIIIVDDASTDNTAEVCLALEQQFPNVTFQLIRHPENKGESAARNTGLLAATAKYIAFLDPDDEWCMDKLTKQIDILEKGDDDIVFCEYFIVTDNDYSTAEALRFPAEKIGPKFLLTKSANCGVGGCMLMRRGPDLSKLLFDENLRLLVDIDWFYRYLDSGKKIALLHEPLTYYHKAPMRSGNIVKNGCDAFIKKYKPILKRYPLFVRRRILSNLNWVIGIGYDRNDCYQSAFLYFIRSLIQYPLRHPGSYYHIFLIFIKIIRNK